MCRSNGCENCDNGDVIMDARELAQQGQTEKAWDKVDLVGDKPCCRTNAVLAIASATGLEEHFEDAMASASHIEDDSVRGHLFSIISLAREEAKTGNDPS